VRIPSGGSQGISPPEEPHEPASERWAQAVVGNVHPYSHPISICDNNCPCPDFIATTAQVICITSPLVAITGEPGWLPNPTRDLFVEVLEQVRRRYHFVVVGYVVMPEHVHLLLSEPERGNPSVVMQAIKQGFARRLLGCLRAHRDPRQGDLCNQSLNPQHVWQRRFYDFVVRTYEKRQEKLHYIHQNPVKASLALEPWQWRWSSAPHYLRGESGPVLVNELVMAEMKIRPVA
jgi:putative transposase